MRLRKGKPLQYGGNPPMSGEACDIAVSEMTGVPLEELYGWVVIAVRETPEGKRPVVVPCAVTFWELVVPGLLRQIAIDAEAS
jgi:hypothetical protein